MAAPRIGSINLVLDDVTAAATFLESLGVELDATVPGWEEWAPHHRNFHAEVTEFGADLDSSAFAAWWGGVPPAHAPGVVLNLRIDSRDEVDRLHALALELGARELKAPWDAFWGARYSVVLAPGPLCVGLMSEPDPSQRAPGPEISDFA
jgi:uncharacterized glyoxalase superfamily protein PhnB